VIPKERLVLSSFQKSGKANDKRFKCIFVITSVIFAVFLIRLVDWQIINGRHYEALAANANTYFIKTDPIRGEIFTYDGEPLAVNNTGFNAILERFDLSELKENNIILKTISIIEKLGCAWNDTLPIALSPYGEFVFVAEREREIARIKKLLRLDAESNAETVIKTLSARFGCENFNPGERRRICSIKYGSFKNGETKAVPLLISEGINEEAVGILSELSPSLPGLKIGAFPKRAYLNGILAPHIVGSIGLMSEKEFEKYKNKGYNVDSVIGKFGVESVMEEFLRGTGGMRAVRLSRDGSVSNTSETKGSRPGKNVYLTISKKLQEAANKSLEENIKSCKRLGAYDCVSGAVVAIDIKNFSVLAAATYPSYDLSKFFAEKNYYEELAAEKSLPLLNRAFNGCFAPGSAFKPLIACAALQSGIVGPDEEIVCNGAFSYYHGYRLHCMGVHGKTNLLKALTRSCNVYFAELGRRLGTERINIYAKKFGLGVKTGLELPESEGILAGPEHSKAVGAPWYEAGSSQSAIGQSDNSFTPLQLAVYAASIARNARLKPHIISKVTDFSGEKIIFRPKAELIEENLIDEDKIRLIREAMRNVVTNGTAANFKNFPITVAAKTGTAQNSGSDHTTFICYAPYENPEIAIGVVIANGKFGTNSKNIAGDIMKCHFGL
jgi:penicillin-binding protein 2